MAEKRKYKNDDCYYFFHICSFSVNVIVFYENDEKKEVDLPTDYTSFGIFTPIINDQIC